MKKVIKQQKELAAILAYALVVAAVAYFAVAPLLGKINSASDKIQQENADQEGKKQRLSELPKMRQQYSLLQDNEGLLDVFFTQDQAVKLIERLEKISQDSGNVIKISVKDSKAQPTASQSKTTVDDTLLKALPSKDYLEMNISLTGKYNSVIQFVNALENFEYYCDITNLELKASTPKENTSSGIQTGVLNPFTVGQNSAKNNDTAKFSGEVDAVMNVVFYTRK